MTEVYATPQTQTAARPGGSAPSLGARPILSVRQIEKVYGNRDSVTRAINDISFDVAPGEFVGIMGASGSGKTTLLNVMATIDRVTSGHIWYGREDITALKEEQKADVRKNKLGLVFQDLNLLDTLTPGENISLALSLTGKGKKEMQQRTEDIMGRLRSLELKDKVPYQVSGGQKQRCACARAIINHPKLVLADEPTGALDSHSAQMLLATLEDMHRQLGATILMVTHDAFSASYAQRILFLRDGAIFSELRRGTDSRKGFFDKILQVLTMMGGGTTDVR